jgi:hypothetical protein
VSDEPKKRTWAWGWVGWTLIVVFVLYPLSAFPVCFIATHCENRTARLFVFWLYWPLAWVLWYLGR